MTSKINPDQWIQRRASDADSGFAEFLGVATPELAVAAAAARCKDAKGEFSISAFESMKAQFLDAQRVKMGLPSQAGLY